MSNIDKLIRALEILKRNGASDYFAVSDEVRVFRVSETLSEADKKELESLGWGACLNPEVWFCPC